MNTIPIDTIHVIFKTHLDIGFTDMPAVVKQTYFDQYIPGAIAAARALFEAQAEEGYIWTTGSWLIAEYLDEASPEQRAFLEAAIRAGEITWHALPFTAHSELMDASLFRYSLSIAKRLDQRFGKQTIAAKMTDVPGDTRAVVHLLAEAGIQFLHIGVNAASPVPDVPPVFVWRDESVSPSAEVIVAYHSDYGGVLTVPGLSQALYIAFTNDNKGPHTAEDIRAIYSDLRAQYPGARVTASTLDAFAAELVKVKDLLPVVTSEIGNSWIHGAGTDPTKVSAFRELMRLRATWEQEMRVDPEDPRYELFSRRLVTVTEHTWGLDEKSHLKEYETFSPDRLETMRAQPNFRKMEESWEWERGYLAEALEALGDLPLRQEAEAALAAIKPCWPNLAGFRSVKDLGRRFVTPHFELAFDPQTGAITHLVQRNTGRAWASAEYPLALLSHQSFEQADWDRFLNQYLVRQPEWAIYDFSRPGVDKDGAKAGIWLPRMVSLWESQIEDGLRLAVELQMPEEARRYGCPRRAMLEIELPSQEPVIGLTLQWSDKPACRLPETLWFTFRFLGCTPTGWQFEKIDRWISPLDVVARGGRSLHGVNSGVRYQVNGERLSIRTWDAAIVAPGTPLLLDFTDPVPDMDQGLHFNLFNNKWGTNFPAWFGEDARFRFQLRFA